jgi:hypothetical protein
MRARRGLELALVRMLTQQMELATMIGDERDTRNHVGTAAAR